MTVKKRRIIERLRIDQNKQASLKRVQKILAMETRKCKIKTYVRKYCRPLNLFCRIDQLHGLQTQTVVDFSKTRRGSSINNITEGPSAATQSGPPNFHRTFEN